jgi:hypothetical protein
MALAMATEPVAKKKAIRRNIEIFFMMSIVFYCDAKGKFSGE